MKPVLTFVTRNDRKFAEAQLVLGDVFDIQQSKVHLTEIQGEPEDILEHKLNEAKAHGTPPFFIDDTLLHFAALEGLPGPYINDFSMKLGAEKLYRLLKDFDDKSAEAVALVGCVLPDGTEKIFRGSIRGSVVAPRGEVLFGWDPIFQPEGSKQTFGEMGVAGKSEISHRAQAFRLMKEFLLKKNG